MLQKEKSLILTPIGGMELVSVRKNKITLSDYDYKKDISNRLVLLNLSVDERLLLEEILFSSIKIPLAKLAKSIHQSPSVTREMLNTFIATGLVTIQDQDVIVDKEMRKYFELESSRFSEDFEPGMEFLQSLLKKVSIHILPIWYAIPRMSDNIFESLLEKYLKTPQIYQRYLLEIQLPYPALTALVQDLLKSPHCETPLSEVGYKYDLNEEQLQEMILFLEFYLIGTVIYKPEGDKWTGYVTFFQEWKNYLLLLNQTAPQRCIPSDAVIEMGSKPFSFVQTLAEMLGVISEEKVSSIPVFASKFSKGLFASHLPRLLYRAKEANLINEEDQKVSITTTGSEWLDLRLENKALYLYRTLPLQELSHRFSVPANEKVIREIEKSVGKIAHMGWVELDEFIQGIQVAFQEDQTVCLRKIGKSWKYFIPIYQDNEKAFIKMVIQEHLFESGLLTLGHYQDKFCISLTPFGQSFFG